MSELPRSLPRAVIETEVTFVKQWWIAGCEGLRIVYHTERRTRRCLVWRPSEMRARDYERLAAMLEELA